MAPQHTRIHEIAWHSTVEHERIHFVPDDDFNPVRGFLIGLAASAVLWAALGCGIGFALTSVGVSS